MLRNQWMHVLGRAYVAYLNVIIDLDDALYYVFQRNH